MQDINQHIALTLQQLRKEKGWSLDKTAAATGVSKAMLGQIERGESSPTIATLWKIVTGFESSFSAFIEPASTTTRTPVSSIQNVWRSSNASEFRHDILAKTIIPFDPSFGFELLQVTLPAGTEHLSAAHASGVTEHVIPLNGSLEIMQNDEWQLLGQGDAIRFDASTPHGYRNSNDRAVSFHNLICYVTK